MARKKGSFYVGKYRKALKEAPTERKIDIVYDALKKLHQIDIGNIKPSKETAKRLLRFAASDKSGTNVKFVEGLIAAANRNLDLSILVDSRYRSRTFHVREDSEGFNLRMVIERRGGKNFYQDYDLSRIKAVDWSKVSAEKEEYEMFGMKVKLGNFEGSERADFKLAEEFKKEWDLIKKSDLEAMDDLQKMITFLERYGDSRVEEDDAEEKNKDDEQSKNFYEQRRDYIKKISSISRKISNLEARFQDTEYSNLLNEMKQQYQKVKRDYYADAEHIRGDTELEKLFFQGIRKDLEKGRGGIYKEYNRIRSKLRAKFHKIGNR